MLTAVHTPIYSDDPTATRALAYPHGTGHAPGE